MTQRMDPCPVGKKGRHDLTFFVVEDSAMVLAVCDMCGVERHYRAGDQPLDDLTAKEIERMTRRK